MLKRALCLGALLIVPAFFARGGSIEVVPEFGLVTNESGTSATFTVRLTTPPSADVTIALSSDDTTEGTVSPALLTFTSANGTTAQTVTVTGVDDQNIDGNLLYNIITAPAVSTDMGYDTMNASDVSVTNDDNDVPRIIVNPTSGLVTSEKATDPVATFTVTLGSLPTGNVTIALSSSDITEGTVSPASLTFTPANGTTAQTVTVTGVDDSEIDDDVAYVILTAPAQSADPLYNDLNGADVLVTNLDNDAVAVPIFGTIAPTFGVTAGSTEVTITGSNFLPGATVKFDGISASNVVIVSDTLITAQTPPHPAALVNVTLQNLNGQPATTTNAYRFNDPPTIKVTAAPPIGFKDQPVTFTAATSDPENDPLVVTFNYGDGSPSDSAGVHTYSGALNNPVVATVTDGFYVVTDTLNFVVDTKIPMLISKLGGKTGFAAKPGKDSCAVSGRLPLGALPAGLEPAGLAGYKISVDCGGATTTEFTLDAKGKAKNKTEKISFALKIKFGKSKSTKKKIFPGGAVDFQIKYGNGTWHDEWANEGIDPTQNRKNFNMPIMTDVSVTPPGGAKLVYTKTETSLLTSKAQKGAAFKFSLKLPKLPKPPPVL